MASPSVDGDGPEERPAGYDEFIGKLAAFHAERGYAQCQNAEKEVYADYRKNPP